MRTQSSALSYSANPAKQLVSTILLLSVIALTGCGGDATESRVESGNREGILHMGNGTEPQTIDPHLTSGIPEYRILTALYEGLVTQDPYTLEYKPGVAESWTLSEDKRTYRFNLRKDAKWSNGDPVTAEDFHWSMMRVMLPELGNQYDEAIDNIVNGYAFSEGEIDDFRQVGVRVIDEYTLEIELVGPDLNFLRWLDAQVFYPVHRETVEAFGEPGDRLSAWTRVGNIITNGPFQLEEWTINSHLKVVKSEHYWNADQVKLNGIYFYPTENGLTEERQFRDGQLHVTSAVPIDKVHQYQTEYPEALRLHPMMGSYFYILNTRNAPLDDVRVRKALNFATDRELIAEAIMQGTVVPSTSYVPVGLEGYESPKVLGFDPDRARELLAEAGYPNGEGFPVQTILYNTQEAHQKIAVAIQQMWKQELNIDVQIQNQEWKVFLDTISNQNFQIGRKGWIGSIADPFSFIPTFITGGGNNETGFGDPRYDDISQRDGLWESDPVKRNELVYEAETILLEAAPIIPIYTYTNRSLIHPSVKGLPENFVDYYNFRYVELGE